MTTNYTTVTAVIPTAFVAHFYRWVANTYDGASPTLEASPQTAAREDPPDELIAFPDADTTLIGNWWAKLSDTARELLSFLAHNAEERFTGSQLADECEALAGPSGAAGTFNWPSRYATKMGFTGPWSWDGEVNGYYMSATNAAVLLAAAKSSDR